LVWFALLPVLAAVFMLGVLGIGVSVMFVSRQFAGVGRDELPKGPDRDDSSLAITANSSEDQVADAVGLVVLGARVTWLDTGEVAEISGGSGSCFAVSPEGHLLTNEHVVKRTWAELNSPAAKANRETLYRTRRIDYQPAVWVFFGREKKYEAKILHVSERYDLAILKVERPRGTYFNLSTSESPARGTRLRAYGFPGAAMIPLSNEEIRERLSREVPGKRVENQFATRDFGFTQTDGTVGRVDTEQGGRRWLQHNSRINQGNSGGPLVLENGAVVGINTAGVILPGDGQGIFYSLALPQLRPEIDSRVPGVVWK
jgi:S1-C subfamily serine protease